MEVDVTKLPEIRPWPNDKKWIDISDEVAYFGKNLLSKEQYGNVLLSVMSYIADKKTKFNLEQAEYIVFCKMLIDNECITDI